MVGAALLPGPRHRAPGCKSAALAAETPRPPWTKEGRGAAVPVFARFPGGIGYNQCSRNNAAIYLVVTTSLISFLNKMEIKLMHVKLTCRDERREDM